MSELTAPTSPSLATRLPAELPVYAACAGLALCTFLPWLRVDLGDMFGGAADADAAAQQFGAMMGRMMPQLDVATSISGLRLGEGKLALVAALVAGGLTYGEAAGHLRHDRRMLRLGAAAAAAVGALSVLFAFTHAGEPLAIAFGIFAATVAAAAAVHCAIRRVQALPKAPAA